MRHNLLLSIVLASVFLLQSCSEQSNFYQGGEVIFYKSEKKIQFEDIVYSARMKGDFYSDTLIVEVVTENTGDKPTELAFGRAELMGQNGVRSKVVKASTAKVLLQPGEKTTDTVYFTPINDMELYKHSSLYGSFGESYFFVPGAIGAIMLSSKGIKLIADEKQYATYQDLGLYEGIRSFDIKVSKALKDTLMQNITALYEKQQEANDTMPGPKPGVRFAKKEMLIGGYGLLSKAYTYKDHLYILWRMVNHQGQQVNFNPANFRITTLEGKSYQPTNIEYVELPANWKNAPNVLKKGERVRIKLQFDEIKAKEFAFQPFISFGENKTLIKEVPLTEVTSTSPE
ncbi:MAG: hypothetical protein WBA74_15095 [Cyclobacteriaceae bacterium]